VKDSKLTRHHVIPRSRNGITERNNIVMITHWEHDKYHQLFQNRIPEEILHYLVNTFWGGNINFIERYLEETRNED